MSNLVYNEKLKLTATFMNNIGIAVFIAASVVPTFTYATKENLY
jgi:hypothetical protein